jgi:hypothetical protein
VAARWANAFGGCAVAPRARDDPRRRLARRAPARLHGARGPPRPPARARARGRDRAADPRHGAARPDRFGRFHGAGYFGNAIPVLAVADAARLQLPPYTFAGESFYSLTSSWRVRLRVPAGLQVASTGPRPGGRPAGRSRSSPAGPRFHARDRALRRARRPRGPGAPARFSIPGTPAAQARRTLRIAALSMTRYAGWYGPYGRPEVDLVEGPGRGRARRGRDGVPRRSC